MSNVSASPVRSPRTIFGRCWRGWPQVRLVSPPNGETICPHPRRVPGFDLTFKTAKSVSVPCAVSDGPSVQGAIVDAGETAVREALGWLEREAVHVRHGAGNEAFAEQSTAA